VGLDRKMISLCRQVNTVAMNILILHCKNIKSMATERKGFGERSRLWTSSAWGFVLASRKLNQSAIGRVSTSRRGGSGGAAYRWRKPLVVCLKEP
jgi:hypothetical protein